MIPGSSREPAPASPARKRRTSRRCYRNDFHCNLENAVLCALIHGSSRLDTGQTQKTLSHLWRVMKVDGTAFLGLLSRSDSCFVPTEKRSLRGHLCPWQSPSSNRGNQRDQVPLGKPSDPFPTFGLCRSLVAPSVVEGPHGTLPPVSILDYTRNDRFDATSKARETHPPLRSLRAPQGAWQTPEEREYPEIGGKE